MNFTGRVEAVRKAQALTVSEVLKLIGVSAPMLSMIKTGSRNPSVKTMRRLIEAERVAGLAIPSEENRRKNHRLSDNLETPPAHQAVHHGLNAEDMAEVNARLATLQEEMNAIRKLLISLLAEERSRGTGDSSAGVKTEKDEKAG